jgi:hypothetical protein
LKGDELYDHRYAVVTGGERAGGDSIGLSKEPVRICPEHRVCLLLLAVMIVYEDVAGPRHVNLRWVGVGIAVSVCMLYRYLKFYREYASELLKRYAELPVSSQGAS